MMMPLLSRLHPSRSLRHVTRRWHGGKATHVNTNLQAASAAATSLTTVVPIFLCHHHHGNNKIFDHYYDGCITKSIIPSPFSQLRGFSSSRNHRVDFRPCRSIEDLLQKAYDHLDVMSHRAISAFWTEAAKLASRTPTRNASRNQQQDLSHQIDALLVRTLEEIETFESRDMAQTITGIAKIINKLSGERRHGSSQQILYNIFIGNNSHNKKFILDELAASSVPAVAKFDARQLSNLIYAFGLVRYDCNLEDGSTLFEQLADSAIPQLRTFNGQDFSNMFLGYAYVGALNSNLFKKAGDAIAARDNLEDFKPQALSNIGWAYATAKESHSKLFKKVGDHVVRLDNLQQFKPQALANIVWAYATVGESHPKLFKKAGDHVVRLDNLQQFKPQELANSVWSYATANEGHPGLFKKVGDHIVKLDNLQRFKPQGLSNIVWAYATANISNPDLFQKVAKAAIEKRKELNAQDIANLLWAFATNGQLDHHLFKSLSPASVALVGKYNCQHLANIAWVYAVADVASQSLFNDDFVKACAKKENDFITEELRQLHQWTLWQKELKSNVRLPMSFEKKCHDAFISREPSLSALQNDIVTQLKAIGLEPEEEVLTGSGYRIDAIVETNKNRVAVEVDGPSHFIGRKRTGSTILKHRQVASLDKLRVVSVPYWEWDEMKEDSNKKQDYLHRLLSFDD